MVRSKVGTRPNEFKYGMALYGAAWPEGDHYFVCGGGGHGLVPRIVWAKYENGKCSDQVGEYKLGKDTPMRMLMCPWGASLLLGNANGGIRRLQVGSDDLATGKPKLVEVSAAFTDAMGGLRDEVGCMAFNARGNLLAVGFKESGLVKVLAYPNMRQLLEFKLKDPEVKDVDFCHLPGLGCELLATVAGDGSCEVWQLSSSGGVAAVDKLVALEPPKGVNRARFIRCRFARNGAAVLFVLLNAGRDASHLAAYSTPEGQRQQPEQGQQRRPLQQQQGPGQQQQALQQQRSGGSSSGGGSRPWQLLKKVKAKDQPASAMDISRGGEWIAAGFADGALRVFHADTLLVKAEAEVSIAFVSGVCFNGDNNAVIAVGGDANCYVMELVPRREGSGGWGGALLVMLLLALFAAGMAASHYWQHPEQLPYGALQQLQVWAQPGQPAHDWCSVGSGAAGGLPAQLQAQLQAPVCEWVARAAAVLPPEALLDGGHHDEL